MLKCSSREIGDNYINNTTRVNEAIRAPFLRVIDANGDQLGVIPRQEALRLAADAGLDLVEVGANANPPVVKIVDWGKYNYQKMKQMQKNKRNTKVSELKQMRFGLKISEHDTQVKLRKVSEFLDDGHKVRLTIVYRGRELAHKDLGYKLLEKIRDDLGDGVVSDQEPQFLGKQLSVVVRSTNVKTKDS